VQGQGF